MERVLEFDNKKYVATYKGATARIYRSLFNSDLLIDLDNAQKKIINKIQSFVEHDVKLEESDVLALIIDVATSEFLEKIGYCAISTTYKLNGKRMEQTFESFVDNVEDYATFIGCCTSVYEMMVYGNTPIVQSVEQNEDEKKRVDTEPTISQVL